MSGYPGRTGDLDWSDANPSAAVTTVLLHSLGTDRTMWDFQIDSMKGSRRVIAIDLPGHGGSRARAGAYSLADLGHDVLGLTGACGVVRFEVVGVSIGGLVAMWLAVNAPQQVSGLVAANTAARLGSDRLWSARIEQVRSGGMEAVREQVVMRFFASDFEARRPDDFRRYNAIFAATDPDGYIGCCAALRDADLTPRVSSIRCSTLIIGGDQDVATPPEQSRWLQANIAGSRLEIIEGAGHLSNVERPEVFGRLVSDFLSVDES